MSNKDKSTFYIPAKKNINENEQNRNNENYVSNIGNNEKKFSTMCRICLMDENEDDNPLISPCKCIGSVRFTHLICLRKWLNAKTVIKHFNNLIVYTFKDFECELCMFAIPGINSIFNNLKLERLKFRNENIFLVDYQRPEGSYVILESISQERKDHKYLYIIQMTENVGIRMGRASDADVRVADISVSRNHALLFIQNGNFYIKDISSKFGTLVQLQNEILFSPNNPIAIQSGKIQIIFSIERNCFSTISNHFALIKIFPYLKCGRVKKINSTDYNDYLKDKVPMYYMQELENFHILDTNYSLNSNDVRSLKKTQHKNEILNNNHEINNENSDVLPTMARGQINYGDMTTNRIDESEGNSIIEGKSRNIVDHSSILDNVTRNNIQIIQSSIFSVPSPITSRREDRETLNLLANYTKRDIINPINVRSTMNLLNANNKNNNIFNSEKNKKINSGNDSLKNSNEKKFFKANSVKSKDPMEMGSSKDQILLDSFILKDDSMFELDFEFGKENIPYVKKINEASKENSDPHHQTLDLRSNSLKKEMERLDTFNPNAFNQFGSKKSRKTHSFSGKKYIAVSEFGEDFECTEILKFKKGQQSEVDLKLFSSFYKNFKNENKLDELTDIQDCEKKLSDKQSEKYQSLSQIAEKKLNDKQSAKFFSSNALNIEKKMNEKQAEKASKKDANKNQADNIADQEIEDLNLNKSIFFKNEDDYDIFKNNYEKILDVNLNFHSNEEPKAILKETLDIIKSAKRNQQREGSLSNSSFKEIIVNSSVNTPISPLYINKIPRIKKKA